MTDKATQLTREQQLGEACERFVSEWHPGKAPDFRAYLSQVHPEIRAELLQQLLQIDLQMQRRPAPSGAPNSTPGTIPQQSLETAQTRISGSGEALTEQLPARTIGHYHLIAKIGGGGMGSVWRAEQFTPIRRTLAIKVIRGGDDSREVLARFETERQALALMDHPHIARIIDAGQTEHGLPFFAMELVDGETITDWCDRRRLFLYERLTLFAQICDAVQHAHQKGIMHRDLKPSNILVTEMDGKPIPKIIDFGLAKAMNRDHQLARQTQNTAIGQLVGTIRYMSPEQAELRSELLDTRTDIYGLGVVLYELLTGSTPLEPELIDSMTLFQTLEHIRFNEPVRPSVRMQAAHGRFQQVLKCRNISEAELNRVLVGELDWIVMKAIAKKPDQRYQSAAALAEDTRRFINGEAVLARPLSTRYRIKKFVSRYRLGFVSASMIAAILLFAILGITWGWFQALSAQQVARNHQVQLAEANRILTEIFADLNLQERTPNSEPLEAVLAERLIQAVDAIGSAQLGDPLGRAQMNLRLGDSLVSLGHAQQAIQPLQDALDTRVDALSWSHPKTREAARALGRAHQAVGNYKAAVSLLETTVKHNQKQLGPADRETLDSMRFLGICYRDVGEQARALEFFRDVHEQQTRLFGEDDADTMESLAAVASCTTVKDAVPMFQKVYDWRVRNNGPTHLKTLTAKADLAFGLLDAEEIPASIALYEELVATNKEILGHHHSNTLRAMNCLASAYQQIRDGRAVPMLEETLRLTLHKHGKFHHHTLQAMNRLADAWRATDDLQKALPLYEETYRLRAKQFGETNSTTLISLNNLGYGYYSAGQYENAQRTFEKAIPLTQQEFGSYAQPVFSPTNGLGLTLAAQGNHRAALAVFAATLNICQHNFGIAHEDAQMATFSLAEQLLKLQRSEDCIKRLRDNVRRVEQKLGRDHFLTQQAIAKLGSALLKSGQPNDAIPLLTECLHSKQFDNRLSWVWGQLIEACHQTGCTDDFYALIAAHIQFGRGQESACDLADILQARAIDLLDAGDPGSAETLLREGLELRQRQDAASWKSSVTRYWLGRVLKSRHQLAEAETLLWSAATELNQHRDKLAVKHKPLVEESMDEWFGTREAMNLSFVNTRTTQQ